MRTFGDPIEDLSEALWKIFEDLQSSCLDHQGSFIFLPWSSRICQDSDNDFYNPDKILARKQKTLKDVSKKTKNP